MKRSGCSQSIKRNMIGHMSTKKIRNINDIYQNDNSIQLMSVDDSSPFVNVDVAAARDGTNQLFMSWNGELVNISMYRIWRILTPNNPQNAKFNDYNSYNVDSDPDEILNGLGNCEFERIHVNEGDLYHDWVNADTYDGYYIMYMFIVQSLSSDEYYCHYWWSRTQITNYCIGNAPSLSYNQSSNIFTIGTSMPGRRILEFHRTDIPYGYPTSISNQDTLHEMLLTSMINEEWDGDSFYLGYYYANDLTLERWAKGRYTVGVNFLDNTNKSTISSAINSALSELNSVLNSYGVYFTRSSTATSGDITITVGSEYDLFGIDLNDGYAQGGHWNAYTDSNGYITSADVQLANDFFEIIPYNRYSTVALEELAQAMGAGHDQYEYVDNTLHVEFNYLNKPDYLTTNDKNILRLVYSDSAPVGGNCTDVSKALNIPKGVYQPSESTSNITRTVSGKFLDSGATYKVRAFIVNSSGEVSYTSSWISVTTPDVIRPNDWEWTTTISSTAYVPMDSLGFHPVTATEWNNFTKRINEFRAYTGYSDYSFSKVSRGQDFTPAIYNQAVNAIKGIIGYGSYLSTISTETTLTADLFLSLRDELNAIP